MRQALQTLRKSLRWIFTVLVLAIALVWCVNNQQPIAINLMPLGYELILPLYVLVASALLVGYLLAVITVLQRQWSARAQLRRLQSRLHNAESLQRQQQLQQHLQQELSADAEDTDAFPAPLPNAIRPDAL